MDYGYKKEVSLEFEKAVEKITEELKKEGFGILSTIDMKKTLKNKLNVDIEEYKIMEACNPPNAYKAIQTEQDIGLMLPCNVILYKKSDRVFVSAILPTVIMGTINNENLQKIAADIENKLKKAINGV